MFDKELFDRNFSFEFKFNVAKNIRTAVQAYDEFMAKNRLFLKDAQDLHGRILAYAVGRQFLLASAESASSYLVSQKEVNAFKAKAVFLHTDDYVTNVCRTAKAGLLPGRAGYKLRLAEGNRENDTPMEFFQDPASRHLLPAMPKKYAIIGYRYENGIIRHLTLLVPDWRFENVIYRESLIGTIQDTYRYIPTELIEEDVAKLKEDIRKIVD